MKFDIIDVKNICLELFLAGKGNVPDYQFEEIFESVVKRYIKKENNLK